MEKMKDFNSMQVDIFDDPAENEAFLDWLILAILFPLALGLPPRAGR
jgi:hypothetical protein